MAKYQVSDLDFVDDLYFSVIMDEPVEEDHGPNENDLFQVSDVKYAEGLQFQEALMGSIMLSQMTNITTPTTIINKSNNDYPSSVLVVELPSPPTDFETGQSSQTFCEICVERKEADQMFQTDICTHSFCSDCISKHVATKIQESVAMVTCPGMNCRGVLELEICRNQLSKGVIDLWEQARCEETISNWQRFYCPYKDCSALLVNDNREEGEVIRESECPLCHRLFCAQCEVPWHSGVECEKYQRLNEDERGREDLMVMEMAKDNNWSRCPRCRFYVERTEGCPHMTCRCKFEFCYGCESEWNPSHGGCQRN